MIAEFIDIELDRPRKMALPLGSLKKAERELNRLRSARGLEPSSIFNIINEQFLQAKIVDVDLDLLLVLIWASLIHEDKELTLEQVEVFPLSLMEAMQKLILCVRAWMVQGAGSSDAVEVGDDAKPPLDLPNGSTSGPPAESTLD